MRSRFDHSVTLLIEDNDDDADLAAMAFRAAKIKSPVVRVRDGQEALDYIFARGSYEDRGKEPLPCVVLLDLKLPRMHGLQVLAAIRADKRTRHLAVVVLSSSDLDRDREASYELHCNSYVQKPVNYDQFVEVCRELGIYWTMVNLPCPTIEAA